jgi:serine/threonine protein kinase
MIGIQYRLVTLTPALSCMPDASDGRDRRALYTAFTAASVLQAYIQGDVNRYLVAKPPAIQKNTYHFPAISKLRIYGSSALEYLKFQILQRHDDLSNHWLYFAETGGPDSQTILIEFVRHYSVDLHAFCAKSGHAPQVLAYEKLPGGWHAVAMEYILNSVLITDSPLLTTYRDKWTEEMKTLVQSFHDNGFVHGDLHNPNIICDDRGNLFLIDFDWGGKEGEAFYPTAKLNEELLEGRTSVDLKITRSDDDRVLHKTLDKLKK